MTTDFVKLVPRISIRRRAVGFYLELPYYLDDRIFKRDTNLLAFDLLLEIPTPGCYFDQKTLSYYLRPGFRLFLKLPSSVND